MDRSRATGESPPEGQSDHWRTAGERIENLLEASSTGGAVARERAEQLVREVVDLYGAGLARIAALVEDTPAVVEAMTRDDLIASLLLIHGVHPHDVETRIRTALDGVRPYLGSHGGDVELLGVRDGVVRLRLLGSCKSCPSSAVTLELAVQEAVRAAAPETTGIEVDTGAPASTSDGLISAESLLAHLHTAPSGAGTWLPAPEFAELAAGEVGGFVVADLPMLVCRLGDEFYAYRDRCPACTNSLAGAVLERRAGHTAATAVLGCPTCRAHYDVRHAGAGLDGRGDHLDPLPVLARDGILSVAVPASVPG